MYAQRRRRLSQNFLTDRRLIGWLVGASSVSLGDTVVEIGPGKGFLTGVLLRAGARVIAIELDAKLVLHLRRFFPAHPRLTLHHGDFLDHALPATPYKVFANIPFAIEGQIVRKLLDAPNPPEDSYLVVRQSLAERLSGLPHQNQFSLRHQPWFDFAIVHRFHPADFTPQPRVASVLWRIKRREQALLPLDEQARYHRFIETAFAQGQPLGSGLRPLLPHATLRRLYTDLCFTPQTKPGYLTLDSWLTIYRAAYPAFFPSPGPPTRLKRQG